MATNWSVALQVKPPEVPEVKPLNPLDSYTKLLTLRELMRKQQTGDIELQQSQLALQEAQQKQQDQAAFRKLYISGQSPTEAQILGTLGTAGVSVLKAQQEFETQRLETLGKKAARLGALAGSIKSPDQYGPTIMQAASEGLIEPQHARDLIANGFNAAEVQQFRDRALTAQQQIEDNLAAQKAERESQLFGPQLAEAKDKAAAADRAEAANRLAPAFAQGPDRFQAALAGETSPLDVMQRALTPEQFVTSQQAATTSAETARHNLRVEELTGLGHTQQ